MIVSRLTSKAQTTIPQAVRLALGLRAGDDVLYQIEEGRVVLTRARKPVDVVEDPFAEFDEWSSDEDRRAYADL